MENDKEFGFNDSNEESSKNAPRARNRTVMLTPDVTGQVRAKLANTQSEAALSSGFINPLQNINTNQASGNFMSASSGKNSSMDSSESNPVIKSGVQLGATQIMQNTFANSHNAAGNSDVGVPFSNNAGGAAVNTRNTQTNLANSFGQQNSAHQVSAPQVRAQNAYQAVAQVNGPRAYYGKITPLVGFLVSFDKTPTGDVYELRSGRLIVTSEPNTTGNFLLVDDATVSVGHAILRISPDGEFQVLDQLSEYGTKIKRAGSDEEEELSGDKASVDHGDIIRFGERRFHVCMLVLNNN